MNALWNGRRHELHGLPVRAQQGAGNDAVELPVRAIHIGGG